MVLMRWSSSLVRKRSTDIESSITFLCKYMLNGIDALNDNGVFGPAITVIFGDSGFIGKFMDSDTLSSGFKT